MRRIPSRIPKWAPYFVAPLSLLTASVWYFSTHDASAGKLRALELTLFGPLLSPFGFFLSAAFYWTFLAATLLPQAFTIGAFFVVGLPAWNLGTQLLL